MLVKKWKRRGPPARLPVPRRPSAGCGARSPVDSASKLSKLLIGLGITSRFQLAQLSLGERSEPAGVTAAAA